jgi:Asp-tRNA(Asn)/Glu-tRNA(Gln) amidotransferase A subunit family amidase
MAFKGSRHAGMEQATPRPAPLAVPAQLFDDSPAAAEVVMPLKGRRVGVYRQLFEDASPDVVAACRHAIELMREHGCEVWTSVNSLPERI